MLILKSTHDAIVAAKDAEIAQMGACMLPMNAKLVLEEMHADCGYAVSRISSHTQVPEKQVRAIIRGFEAFGWAFKHPFFSEDDNFIHGSGYSLTNEGWDVRQALLARAGEA